MVKVSIAISKGHELVKMVEFECDSKVAEAFDGYVFPGLGEYEGCMCEVVGVE